MNRNFRKLSVTLIIEIIIIAFFIQLPLALSAEENMQVSTHERAMTFMTQVIGLDVEKYSRP